MPLSLACRRPNRWQVMAVGLLVESLGGVVYAFGLYSNDIKARFSLSQGQLAFLGTAGNMGGNMGVHMGLLCDRYGPRITMALAGLVGVAGWAIMWLALATAWRPAYGVLALASFLQGHSQMIADIAVLSAVGFSFPANRGAAMGMCKALIGLSGALVAQVYKGFFEPHAAPLLLYLVVEVAVVCTLGTIFTQKIPADGAPGPLDIKLTNRYLRICLAGVLSLGVYLLVAALAANLTVMSAIARAAVSLVAFSIFFAIVLFLVCLGGKRGPYSGFVPLPRSPDDREQLAADDVPLVPVTDDSHDELTGGDEIKDAPSAAPAAVEVYNFSYKEALKTPWFYVHMLLSFCFSGCTLLVINNIGQIVLTIGGTSHDKGVYVTLISAFNCFGRVCSGFVGDYLCKRYSIPRPVLYIFTMAICLLGFFFLMLSSLAALYPAAMCIGWSFGSVSSLLPTVTAEMFGNKNFGAIVTTNGLSYALSAYLFPTLMAAAVYDAHIAPDSNECFGRECYFTSFLVCACLIAFSLLLSLWLTRAARPRYLLLFPPSPAK